MKIKIFIIIIAGFLVGCSFGFQEISGEELKEKLNGSIINSAVSYWYVKEDDSYYYIDEDWITNSNKYKISKEDIEIDLSFREERQKRGSKINLKNNDIMFK